MAQSRLLSWIIQQRGNRSPEQACGNADDIDRAVAAAKACHDSRALSALRPVERSRKVQQMGRYLAENVKEIAPAFNPRIGQTPMGSRNGSPWCGAVF